MNALLSVGGLEKDFGGFMAVNGVDLQIQAGTMTSIIGPNGAGKTTLINLVTGSLQPSAGRITFLGKDITNLPIHQRVRMGMSRSFQISDILANLSVYKNVMLPVLARHNYTVHPLASLDGYPDVHSETADILRSVGLWNIRHYRADELSHGDQRLLEIGMAVAPSPQLCYLDEPCAGMNPMEHKKVLGLIKHLAEERNLTFVLVEHDMDVVFSVSDWVVVMNKGEVLAEGVPDEIRGDPIVRSVYLGEDVR